MKKNLLCIWCLFGSFLCIAPLWASSNDARQVALGFYEDLFNRHDLSAIDRYIAPEFIDHDPDPGQKPDREGVRKAFAAFLVAFPDLKVKIDIVIVEGNRVAVRFTETATQKGDFVGMPASGKRYQASGIDIIEIRNGKWSDRWGFFDVEKMMGQLKVSKPSEVKK